MTVYAGLKGIVRDWHDGDTGHIDVQLPFGFWLMSYTIDGRPLWSCRLQGVDNGKYTEVNAPELGSTSKPNQPGLDALAHMEQLCPVGTLVTVDSVRWDTTGGGWDFDKFGGRWDAVVTLPDGSDLGARMVADGFAEWVTA